MSKALVWDKTGERLYETGVSKCALYPQSTDGSYPLGVAWNGITAVNKNPSGAEATALYADNIKYMSILSTEEFAATIEAYMYPDEFAECDGSAELLKGVKIGQQKRKAFGLAYRTELGNDVEGTDLGYKLNLIYGALAAPSDESNSSVNGTPEAKTFSWSVSTTPVNVAGRKPTATVEIDSTKVDPKKMAAIEKVLYGDENADPRLPLPDEIKSIMEAVEL